METCVGCGCGLAPGEGLWEPVDGVLSEASARGPFCSETCEEAP